MPPLSERDYARCPICGKPMRKIGQKLVDHPGTVAKNSKDNCVSCYERQRRGGSYTGDVRPDPEHLRTVAGMVGARFAGNDLEIIAAALGVQGIDTRGDVH